MKILDGILGNNIGSNYTIELKEDTKPYQFPKIHEPTLKKEVNRLIRKSIIPNGKLPPLSYKR